MYQDAVRRLFRNFESSQVPNIASLLAKPLQHLAEKLAHYLSETGNAYSEDPPGEIMKHRMQQAQERGHVGQHHCKAL